MINPVAVLAVYKTITNSFSFNKKMAPILWKFNAVKKNLINLASEIRLTHSKFPAERLKNKCFFLFVDTVLISRKMFVKSYSKNAVSEDSWIAYH